MLARRSLPSISLPLLTYRCSYFFLPHLYMDDYKRNLKKTHPNKFMFYFLYIPKYMWYTTKSGSLDLWDDIKKHRQISKKKESDRTAQQVRHAKRNTADLLKFIPFSLFLIIPAAELLIPPYLFFFPHAVPSTYIFDTVQERRQKLFDLKRRAAFNELVAKVGNIPSTEVIKNQIRESISSKTQDQKAKAFKALVDYKNMSSDDLILVCRCLGVYYVTGTHIINQTVNVLTYYIPTFITALLALPFSSKQKPALNWQRFENFKNFRILKFNYQPFEFFKRRFLIKQIEAHFKKVEKQDQRLLKFGFDKLKPHELKEMLRDRGFPILTCYKEFSNVLIEWAVVNADERVTNEMTILYSIAMSKELLKGNIDYKQ